MSQTRFTRRGTAAPSTSVSSSFYGANVVRPTETMLELLDHASNLTPRNVTDVESRRRNAEEASLSDSERPHQSARTDVSGITFNSSLLSNSSNHSNREVMMTRMQMLHSDVL